MDISFNLDFDGVTAESWKVLKLLKGREALSSLYSYEFLVQYTGETVSAARGDLGRRVHIKITSGSSSRDICGVIMSVEAVRIFTGTGYSYNYKWVVRPELAKACYSRHRRVWQHKKKPDKGNKPDTGNESDKGELFGVTVIKNIVGRWFPNGKIEISDKAKGAIPKSLLQLRQNDESDYNFFARLLSSWGLGYKWEFCEKNEEEKKKEETVDNVEIWKEKLCIFDSSTRDGLDETSVNIEPLGEDQLTSYWKQNYGILDETITVQSYCDESTPDAKIMLHDERWDQLFGAQQDYKKRVQCRYRSSHNNFFSCRGKYSSSINLLALGHLIKWKSSNGNLCDADDQFFVTGITIKSDSMNQKWDTEIEGRYLPPLNNNNEIELGIGIFPRPVRVNDRPDSPDDELITEEPWPEPRMRVFMAVVEDVSIWESPNSGKDPLDGRNLCKVREISVNSGGESAHLWVELASPHADANSGIFARPRKDNVLICLDRGDMSIPLALGTMFRRSLGYCFDQTLENSYPPVKEKIDRFFKVEGYYGSYILPILKNRRIDDKEIKNHIDKITGISACSKSNAKSVKEELEKIIKQYNQSIEAIEEAKRKADTIQNLIKVLENKRDICNEKVTKYDDLNDQIDRYKSVKKSTENKDFLKLIDNVLKQLEKEKEELGCTNEDRNYLGYLENEIKAKNNQWKTIYYGNISKDKESHTPSLDISTLKRGILNIQDFISEIDALLIDPTHNPAPFSKLKRMDRIKRKDENDLKDVSALTLRSRVHVPERVYTKENEEKGEALKTGGVKIGEKDKAIADGDTLAITRPMSVHELADKPLPFNQIQLASTDNGVKPVEHNQAMSRAYAAGVAETVLGFAAETNSSASYACITTTQACQAELNNPVTKPHFEGISMYSTSDMLMQSADHQIINAGGEIVLTAAQGIILQVGTSYIKITEAGIEISNNPGIVKKPGAHAAYHPDGEGQDVHTMGSTIPLGGRIWVDGSGVNMQGPYVTSLSLNMFSAATYLGSSLTISDFKAEIHAPETNLYGGSALKDAVFNSAMGAVCTLADITAICKGVERQLYNGTLVDGIKKYNTLSIDDMLGSALSGFTQVIGLATGLSNSERFKNLISVDSSAIQLTDKELILAGNTIRSHSVKEFDLVGNELSAKTYHLPKGGKLEKAANMLSTISSFASDLSVVAGAGAYWGSLCSSSDNWEADSFTVEAPAHRAPAWKYKSNWGRNLGTATITLGAIAAAGGATFWVLAVQREKNSILLKKLYAMRYGFDGSEQSNFAKGKLENIAETVTITGKNNVDITTEKNITIQADDRITIDANDHRLLIGKKENDKTYKLIINDNTISAECNKIEGKGLDVLDINTKNLKLNAATAKLEGQTVTLSGLIQAQ